MNDKLKPCPFCGGRAILEHTDLRLNWHNSHESIKGLYSSTWQVSCFNCGIRKSSHTSYYKFTNQGTLELPKNEIDGRAEAIENWNRRVIMKCKYYKDEFCVNADCPYVADYCPVTESEEICVHNSINENNFVKLPYKVGEEIYTIIYLKDTKKIVKTEIACIKIEIRERGVDYNFLFDKEFYMDEENSVDNKYLTMYDQMFKTKAEAEAKLKELKRNGKSNTI